MMLYFTSKKQNGYTLIELLLVITVIALIAALGVKTYRDKAESDRINIAALNIQHVLEAAMSYNVSNDGLWPQINWTSPTDACKTGTSVGDQNFLINYLPNESNQSNFGTALCWDGDDPTRGVQKAPRFWVALKVGDDSSTDTANTAQRIAARLPNAIITNDPGLESTTGTPSNKCDEGPCFVKAVISVPSASTEKNKMYIAGAGNCDPSIPHGTAQPGSGTNVSCTRTTIADQFPSVSSDNSTDSLSQYDIAFQCKAGEVPGLYVTPNFLRMDRYNAGTQGNHATEPLYMLTGETIADPNQTADKKSQNPPDFQSYTQNCPDPPDAEGMVKCRVNLAAEYNAQGAEPMTIVGCTTALQGEGVCTCQPDSGECPAQPGAIGASYLAVCNPAGSTQLAADKSSNNYW